MTAINHSKQRDAILGLVRSTDQHPTADWIFEQVRRQLPQTSLATVYRNLKQLAETGQIRAVRDERLIRFDRNLKQHDHFRCRRCGALFDIECDTEDLQTNARASLGVAVDHVQVEISGTCADCLANQIEGESI